MDTNNSNSSDTKISSSGASADPATQSTNYSRWMTDSFNEIKNLKLGQLAIPGSHNAGADKGAIDFIGQPYTACQNGRFLNQLNAGSRYFDLRLFDNSYKKTVGNHSPTYKFVEQFEFQHGTWGNRRLEHLVNDVKVFSEANPHELILLHFKSYDKGTNYAFNSLERFFKHLEVIKSRLLPTCAINDTVGEIVARYPGANIILSFPHGGAEGWPTPSDEDAADPVDPKFFKLWGDIGQRWNLQDSSEKGITDMIVKTMKSPPTANLWCLSATVHEGRPKHLMRNSPVRTIPFNDSGRKINILMADFIEEEETRVSVVDECIKLNKMIGLDSIPPSQPQNFMVRQFRLTDEGAEEGYVQNTTLFTWGASTDAIGIRRYEVYQNNRLLFSTGENRHLVKDLDKLNSKFKVCAVDIAGNISPFSNEVELIQDTEPPGMPGGLAFIKFGYPTVRLDWMAANDDNGSGIARYEIRIDGVFHGSTTELYCEIPGLSPDKSYLLEVRAVDRNGNSSEWQWIERHPLPKLTNPRIDYQPLDMDPNLFKAVMTWDPIQPPHYYRMPLSLDITTDSLPLPLTPYQYGQPVTYVDYAQQGGRFKVNAKLFLELTGEESTDSTIDINVDLGFPAAVKNLKVVSETATHSMLSWGKSESESVESYAISVNDSAPVFIPATAVTYPLPKGGEGDMVVEVWAVTKYGTASVVSSATIVQEPLEPPLITQPAEGSAVTTTKPEISGRGKPSAVVSVYQAASDAVLYGSGGVDDAGYWFVTPDVPLPIGTFPLTCKQTLAGQVSDWSKTVTFTVLDPSKPKPPGGLRANISSHFVDMYWFASGGEGITYIYTIDGQQERAVNGLQVKVEGLTANTAYVFTLWGVNSQGERSDPVQYPFNTAVGSPPKDFRVTSNAGGSISFEWNEPDGYQGVIAGYNFRVAGLPKVSLTTTCHTANNLPGLLLRFDVQCKFTDGHESEWSMLSVLPKP